VATAPAATADVGAARFPYTEQPYRLGRVMIRYPIMGYRYSQATGTCHGEPCPHFVNLDVTGPSEQGMVAAPASFGIAGEIFPIEFAGISAGFERYGYSTDHTVIRSDGSEGNFGDGIHRIQAGGRFRLPLLNNRADGPLDIIVDLGYQGQDFIFFETVDQSNAWTFSNVWVHGFRFGGGLRFQAIPQLVIHGDWHGTGVGSGIISHEAEIGAQIRVYKMVTVDVSWLLLSRSIVIAKNFSFAETASVTDTATGVGISAGAVF